MLFWMRWLRWFNGPILLSRIEPCCDSGYVGGERTATTADQSSALIHIFTLTLQFRAEACSLVCRNGRFSDAAAMRKSLTLSHFPNPAYLTQRRLFDLVKGCAVYGDDCLLAPDRRRYSAGQCLDQNTRGRRAALGVLSKAFKHQVLEDSSCLLSWEPSYLDVALNP
jgi:hypothetical protein